MASATHPRRLIGVSMKMYFSLARTKDFTSSLLSRLETLPPQTLSRIDIFMLPDFIALPSTISQLQSSPVKIWTGAQDCHWEDYGAFSGEVSPAVLREAGTRIVMVGHAERRRLFGEDDATVAKKAAAICRHGMVPLVCIGERTGGDTSAAVDECRVQLEAVLTALPAQAEVIVAYEPVWAIGASRPAGTEHVLQVVEGMRKLECMTRRQVTPRILYGGSAGPGLYAQLKEGLDGLFLARFGHDPVQFVKTVQEVAGA